MASTDSSDDLGLIIGTSTTINAVVDLDNGDNVSQIFSEDCPTIADVFKTTTLSFVVSYIGM
jgi:hypothetical protein